MKKVLIFFLSLLMILFLVPASITGLMQREKKEGAEEQDTVKVWVQEKNAVEEMDKEEYLKCVLAAEIAPSFSEETLKAQAVTARSYLENHIYYQDQYTVMPEHQGAVVCTNPAHCSAWCSLEDKKAEWGEQAEEYAERITKAVKDTKGQIMAYGEEPVLGVFHQACGGKTESAEDVWGEDIPYLKAVESKGDDQYPEYVSELKITRAEFLSAAKKHFEGIDEEKELVSEIERSESGGIKSLVIGGVKTAGTVFRSVYELRSTNAEIAVTDDYVVIKTKGNGHCVGMSQYGAEYLAKKGKGYKKILSHYFSGIKIKEL